MMKQQGAQFLLKNHKILIIAGGTGGHIFPGLAIARALKKRGVVVEWLGTPQGLESELVPKENIPLHVIPVHGLRGKGLKKKLMAPFQLLKAFFKSIFIIRKVNPDVVLALGGYVCGPAGVAAWICRKPLVLHEQNAIFGLTNRLLLIIASKVLTGFDIQSKYQYVGNPVRADIANIPLSISLHQPLHLLIFGGSQGASSFNQLIPEAISMLSKNTFEIWHQAGRSCADKATSKYRAFQINAKITEFIDDMASAYQWADVMICRAGALTIAELSAAGKAAIIIPYPYAVDDHQTENAKYLSNKNAAILLPHAEFTAKKLASILENLIKHPDLIKKLAANAYALRKIDATERVVEKLETRN